MGRWISALPAEQVSYYAACEITYRRLIDAGMPLDPIGDHFGILAGYAFRSAEFVEEGIPLLRNINVKPDRIDWTETVRLSEKTADAYERFRLAPGDLVMSMDGTVNRQGLKLAFLGQSDVPALLLQRVCRFEPQGSVQPRFLYHILHSEDFLDHLDASNRSIAIPHVSPGQLKSFKIPVANRATQLAISEFLDSVRAGVRPSEWPLLPGPLQTQRGLVARVEELAARIHEARTLRHQVAEQVDALVKAAVGEVIGPDWPVVPLEAAVDPERPVTYGIVQAGDHVPDGVPYIRVSDMVKTHLTVEGMLRTSPAIAARYRRSAVREGDIVFAIRATIGKMRFVPKDLDGANLTQGTARIAPSDKAIAPYLFWALQGRDVVEAIQSATKGSTFKEITLGRLRTIPVPLPPICEQHRIVMKLDALQAEVDALKRVQAETAAELDALLPAVLDRAFKGEL